MRKIIITISIIIIVTHAILLVILNSNSDILIDKSSGFIRDQIDKKLNQELSSIKTTKTFRTVKSVIGEYVNDIDEKIAFFETSLNEEIPLLINELKAANGQVAIPMMESVDYAKLFHDKKYFKEWLRYKYHSTLRELNMDLNIFLLTNLIILFLIGFINLKMVQTEKVKLLSIVAISAVLISSFLYLFDQNWFYAIIFNSYIGYSYSLIILTIFGVLTDIGFNQGRIIKSLWYIP